MEINLTDLTKDYLELMDIVKKYDLSEEIYYLNNRKNKIIYLCHKLLIEANQILEHSSETNRIKLKEWKHKFIKLKKLDNKLIHDAFIDLGVNH